MSAKDSLIALIVCSLVTAAGQPALAQNVSGPAAAPKPAQDARQGMPADSQVAQRRAEKNSAPSSEEKRAEPPMPKTEQAMPGMSMPHEAPPGRSEKQSAPVEEKKAEGAMPGMEKRMPGKRGSDAMHGMNHGIHAGSLIEEIVHHGSAGTTAEPNSTPTPMLMTMKGRWMWMFHGVAFLNATEQSGPRGYDKVFGSNWLMPMAQTNLGAGTLTLRTMLSLEPATITGRRYPELFQVGETAFRKPIVDSQHPHDFFMELAALYDLKLGDHGLLSFYVAPVGDPAMGPTAFPHRMSASENPLAALGHHLQDSTHIADEVVTLGLTYRSVRLEASGFHGREPDEYRWNIDSGKIDSWSTRLTVNPAQNWSGQYSVAQLKSPEANNPLEDILRMTASVSYNRPLVNGNWASTILWGRNRTSGEKVFNSYLAESTVRFLTRNYLWGRAENVDRPNDLALGEQIRPPGFQERFLARVQAYTLGYDHDIDLIPHLATAFGGQVTFYNAPRFLDPVYGRHPTGVVLFLRLRPYGDLR